MHLTRLVARGFRNLDEVVLDVPEGGLALLGRNGQGKTNLLEAVCYPVLLRSFRGASDADVAAFGGPGFRLEAQFRSAAADEIVVTYAAAGRRKRVQCDGADEPRLSSAIGRWLAVVFLPDDVALAGGGATLRRHYLDRMLSLADRGYLVALVRYRRALLQRNAALRQGRTDVVQACEPALARSGAQIVAARARWGEAMAEPFAAELEGLGEPGEATLAYRGRPELAETAAWTEALKASAPRDRQRGLTTVGPHRDDLALALDGRALRTFGSTGQLRSAAIALKLLELETLRAVRGAEPALVLDDVFAELDDGRQRRLAARLQRDGARQVFVSAPRADELPTGFALPRWRVEGGRVQPESGVAA